MDLKKIKALIDLLSNSKLLELDVEEDGWRLRISRNSAPADAKAVAFSAISALPEGVSKKAPVPQVDPVVTTDGHIVTSPMFGVFCLTPAPGKPPFVQVGDVVHKGQKLCMLEAMKLLHALDADRDGKITAILVENGREVDLGQPLFEIE